MWIAAGPAVKRMPTTPQQQAAMAVLPAAPRPRVWFADVRPVATINNDVRLDNDEQDRTVWLCTSPVQNWPTLGATCAGPGSPLIHIVRIAHRISVRDSSTRWTIDAVDQRAVGDTFQIRQIGPVCGRNPVATAVVGPAHPQRRPRRMNALGQASSQLPACGVPHSAAAQATSRCTHSSELTFRTSRQRYLADYGVCEVV